MWICVFTKNNKVYLPFIVSIVSGYLFRSRLPGNHTSAGKRKHGKTTKGNSYLRAKLTEIVWGISHTKNNYLSAQYHRLARRIGKTKAIVAVSHTVAVNFYHMITKRIPYRELGANYFDTLDRERLTKHTVKRLEALGYEVTLTQREVDV